ncbi:hypothetical protein FHL15_001610 [Xylaria flabelliformis]|uniref:Uncharacterized protein n=1 Tax=Xylaria flabelliformis TaxID=2512241 RepID=A0A553IAW0_9PEZI|nr:hypothetical protein FHL15_001610 [Xylaria flabelliformis]
MTCIDCPKRNHVSFAPFLAPESYRPCMDDYEVCSAMHRDIERYNDDFDGTVDYLLDEANLLDDEDRESIITIQLMLALFVERIYNLQRELSRASVEICDQKDRLARLNTLCREFETKATVLYKFREKVAAAPRTSFGAVEMSAKEWKGLIRELQNGVSRVFRLF